MPCPDCAAALAPGARFCHQCGRRVDVPADSLQAGDRRVVTALFADLVGYTRLVDELDAEVVRERVDRAFAALAEAVLRFGGSLEKFVGDAVLAVFGAPVGHDDDATRAALCALDMQAALGRAGLAALAAGAGPVAAVDHDESPLRLRIGIATGEVVAAIRDVAGVRSIALTGDPMTTAARLQQLAEPGEILLDDATVVAAGLRIESQRVEERVLRGQRRAVRVHRLVAERRVIRHAPLEGPPLVGRDAERDTLRGLFRETLAGGRGRAALLRGEAGIGKSRLLAELEPDARAAGFGWVWIDNVSYGTGAPYRAARCLVDWLAEEQNVDPGAMARELLFGEEPDEAMVRRMSGAIAALARESNMGGWEAEEVLAPADPEQIVADLRLVTRRFVAGLVALQPRVIVVDDLHWADRSSLPLIDELVRAAADLPLVVLAGTRPPVMPEWTSLPHCEVIELHGLDREATEALAGAVVGGPLDAETGRWLHERTAGNALFIGEIARTMRDGGRFERVDGRMRIAADGGAASLPLTLRALLGARIDALPAGPRATLDVAAAVGITFPEWLLRDMRGADAEGSAADLRELAAAGLIEPAAQATAAAAGGRWQFRHALYHEAAYGRLLGERRRQLHAQIADRLALVNPAVPAAELARHRVSAGDVERALPLLERAASEAAALGAVDEAAGFRQAAANLGRQPNLGLVRERETRERDTTGPAEVAVRAISENEPPVGTVEPTLLRDQ